MVSQQRWKSLFGWLIGYTVPQCCWSWGRKIEPARPERGSNSQRNKAHGKGSRTRGSGNRQGGPVYSSKWLKTLSTCHWEYYSILFKGIFVWVKIKLRNFGSMGTGSCDAFLCIGQDCFSETILEVWKDDRKDSYINIVFFNAIYNSMESCTYNPSFKKIQSSSHKYFVFWF